MELKRKFTEAEGETGGGQGFFAAAGGQLLLHEELGSPCDLLPYCTSINISRESKMLNYYLQFHSVFMRV